MIIKKTNNKHFSMIIAYGMLFCHMKILYRINIIYRIFAYQKIIVFKISNQISDSNLIMIEKSPVILYLKILLKLQRIYSLGCSVLTSFLYTDGIKNFVKNQKFRQKSKNLLKIEKVSHEQKIFRQKRKILSQIENISSKKKKMSQIEKISSKKIVTNR